MTTIGGRYRLESQLGQGGMGSVHRATDLQTGETVALKRMYLPDSRSRARRAILRFQREFHTLASLRHPRIIRAFDYGVDADGPYYTMELLAGVDLRDVIRERAPLPPEEVCRILRDVASALAALHARNLIHRDLSPRNVRIVDDRAVLFDFGVLVNAGWVGDVAGTPAFVAPEMLRGVPIDGRADLYSLGVLGYGMLTGTRPYDARSLHDLEAAWAQPVAPPSAHAPVPEALEDLVLDLLCLEPLGRPPSAAVIIDRLTALGGLKAEPELAVDPGYVESAALVGRDRELTEITDLLRDVKHGMGRAFVVEAESGAGKSRLLQEVAIRAKLEGAVTARVACEQSDGEPYAALAVLMKEAFTAAPEETTRATRKEAPLLGRVFDSVRQAHSDVPLSPESGEPAEDRMRIHTAIARAIRRLAVTRPVVLLVDDVQRCDEASAAAFAGLARAEVPGLLLGIARRLGEPIRARDAVAALATVEPRLRLGGLDEAGTEALLRSIFGDAPQLSRLAHWMVEATGGSPLFCTELTRHMIEEEVVRYDGGTWILPEEITHTGMPDGLAEAMRRRVGGLRPSTRAVGEVLAVHGREVRLEEALSLADTKEIELPGDDRTAAVLGALGELGQQGVLVDEGPHLHFRHDALREALLAGIDPERRRRLHRHVGKSMLASGAATAAEEAEIGWHLHHGGDEEGGAEMLERAGRRLFQAQALADCIPPLTAALEVRERRGAPDAVIAELSYTLLSAGWVSNREVGALHSERPIDIYADISGFALTTTLSRFVGYRLAFPVALAWAYVRWLFRPGEARGPHPIRALSYFGLGLSYATAIAYAANQKEKVRACLSRAEPFRAFAGQPPFAIYRMLHGMNDILCGRLESASTNLSEARRLATAKYFNPLTQDERRLAEAGIRATRMIVDVNQFDARLYDDLEAIEGLGLEYYRLAARSVCAVRHRYRGEEKLAREMEGRLEAQSLSLGAWSTDLQRLLFAHPAYALTHDVEGLKRALDGLERRMAEGMALSARVAITRAEIHRELGEYDLALSILEPLIDELSPDDHLYRQYALSAAGLAALESYQYERAAKHAIRGIDEGRDPTLRLLLPWLRSQRVLALADDALGRSDAAAARLEGAIEEAERRDCPIFAGELHEARARVALAAGDRVLFDVHREKCDAWLRPTENPGLVSIAERLAELGREAAVRPVDPRRRRPGASTTESSVLDSGTVSSEGSAETETVVERPKGRRGQEESATSDVTVADPE